MLASYTVNEFGDSFAIVALAVLVYDRTGEVAPTAALFLAGKFVPALIAPFLTARLDQTRRAPHAAVALRDRGARLRRARPGSRRREFALILVLVLALVDGAIAVTARALTRGAIASILQPVHLLREGNALLNIGFALAAVGGSALAGLLISEVGLSAALLADAASFVVIAIVLARHAATCPGPRASRRRRSNASAAGSPSRAAIRASGCCSAASRSRSSSSR